MSIALIAAAALTSPLQQFLSWIQPASNATEKALQARRPYTYAGRLERQTGPAQSRIVATPGSVRSMTAHRPLRVVRIVDTGQSSNGTGRMVISGRLADVCAELDRLAAREAGRH
jgi:hypothetical protein